MVLMIKWSEPTYTIWIGNLPLQIGGIGLRHDADLCCPKQSLVLVLESLREALKNAEIALEEQMDVGRSADMTERILVVGPHHTMLRHCGHIVAHRRGLSDDLLAERSIDAPAGRVEVGRGRERVGHWAFGSHTGQRRLWEGCENWRLGQLRSWGESALLVGLCVHHAQTADFREQDSMHRPSWACGTGMPFRPCGLVQLGTDANDNPP